MARYRKKPVVIEAVRWMNVKIICPPGPDWFAEVEDIGIINLAGDTLWIKTLEGEMQARPGDWVIRGIKGEIYPCKDEIFQMTYEPVEDDSGDITDAFEAIRAAGGSDWDDIADPAAFLGRDEPEVETTTDAADIPELLVDREWLGATGAMPLALLLARVGFTETTAEARSVIAAGGFHCGPKRTVVTYPQATIRPVDGLVIRVGKTKQGRIRLTGGRDAAGGGPDDAT